MPSLAKKTKNVAAPVAAIKGFTSLIQASLKETETLKLVGGVEELRTTTSITQLVDLMLRKAWQSGASDIHVDPQADNVIVRYRIDGVLHDIVAIDKEKQPLVITRIKVLSGMRTDEHLMAQDGRFHIVEDSTDIELRVSILPTFNGENVVIRLLVGGANVLKLEDLGFSEKDLTLIRRYIHRPYGMILATGPTGSGKTTSLYSVLRVLNTRDVSIVTIEDPIEYAVDGITQLQVNTATGFTFANGLRSIVRQDPNVIMVGEIRDQETAGIAVNAAMTGHLLLSTLHTIDAATSLPRLLDMGIEPFLIASTVDIVIGQRLVRKLCPECRVAYALKEEERMVLARDISPETLQKYTKFFQPKGCDACSHTGYTKRIGIYEVIEVTEQIRELIMHRTNAEEIRGVARKQGMVTMFEDGFLKASQGITSIAEIIRVISD